MPSLRLPPPDVAAHAALTAAVHGVADTAALLATPIAGALDHNGTTVGLYGAAPVARAGAIAAPTAPSVVYAQAEAQSAVAAINALRDALRLIGITL